MPTENICIAELLREVSMLDVVSDTPRLDLEVLLCHVLGKPRSYLYTWPEKLLENETVVHFNDLLQRRADGEPIAYLTGEKEFWSLLLEVDSSTLIPRPDTELLVETALNLLDKPRAQVLDLGTGSGAIALALANDRPGWQIIAVDCMAEVVALAEKNRQRLEFANVRVLQSNWFDSVGEQKFDLIVTNPPYIDALDQHLNEGDVRFEPRTALVSENEGLADIKIIIGKAKTFLEAKGFLLIEHGFQQARAVRSLFEDEGFVQIATRRDMAGHERLTLACFNAL